MKIFLKDSKQPKVKKSAFSLIELSIVILIIGLLIAGITQSSRLVNKFRLSTAKSLTQSSPVLNHSSLVLWLESISEDSFDSTLVNDSEINIWYNKNIHDSSRLSPVKGSIAPKYGKNVLNNYPAVKFNAANSSVVVNNIFPSSILSVGGTTDANEFTIFMVFAYSDSNPANLINIDGAEDITLSYNGSSGAATLNWNGTSKSCNLTSGGNVKLLTISKNNFNATNHFLVKENGVYRCGGNVSNETFAGVYNASTTANLSIGNAPLANTNLAIGEVVIFSSALTADQITEIENYLKSKWNI